MLLKGLSDVQVAPDPNEAAAMALLRLIHSADLPDPAVLLARLAGGGETSVAECACRQTCAGAIARRQISRAWSRALEASGKHRLGIQLRDHVGLVRFAPGELVLRPLRPLGADFARELAVGRQGCDRLRLGGVASPTRAASRRFTSRTKWPRRRSAPKCSASRWSARCSKSSPTPNSKIMERRKMPEMPSIEQLMQMARERQGGDRQSAEHARRDRGRGRVGRRAGQGPRHRQGPDPRRRNRRQPDERRRKSRCSRIC